MGYDPDGNTLAQTVQTRDPSGNVQTFIAFGYDASGNPMSISDPVALADPSSVGYQRFATNH
jgi:YD repeat-containing protein